MGIFRTTLEELQEERSALVNEYLRLRGQVAGRPVGDMNPKLRERVKEFSKKAERFSSNVTGLFVTNERQYFAFLRVDPKSEAERKKKEMGINRCNMIRNNVAAMEEAISDLDRKAAELESHLPQLR